MPKIVPRVIFELGPDAPQLASEQGMQVRLNGLHVPTRVFAPLNITMLTPARSVDLNPHTRFHLFVAESPEVCQLV